MMKLITLITVATLAASAPVETEQDLGETDGRYAQPWPLFPAQPANDDWSPYGNDPIEKPDYVYDVRIGGRSLETNPETPDYDYDVRASDGDVDEGPARGRPVVPERGTPEYDEWKQRLRERIDARRETLGLPDIPERGTAEYAAWRQQLREKLAEQRERLGEESRESPEYAAWKQRMAERRKKFGGRRKPAWGGPWRKPADPEKEQQEDEEDQQERELRGIGDSDANDMYSMDELKQRRLDRIRQILEDVNEEDVEPMEMDTEDAAGADFRRNPPSWYRQPYRPAHFKPFNPW